MPQVILSVPQRKLPLLNDVLNALGIDKVDAEEMVNDKLDVPSASKRTVNTIFKKYFGWEYFSNELEFE